MSVAAISGFPLNLENDTAAAENGIPVARIFYRS
jgi:hypothetical protein